jgi:hypothetical protein
VPGKRGIYQLCPKTNLRDFLCPDNFHLTIEKNEKESARIPGWLKKNSLCEPGCIPGNRLSVYR